MHYWQSGLFIITATAKVLIKGTSKSVRFEGSGQNLERLLTIANECVFALVDPVKVKRGSERAGGRGESREVRGEGRA
jgi:hypothetical protein